MKKAGAFISDGNLVKFPAHLIDDAIASTPSRIVMCDRDGQPAMFLEERKVYYGTGSDCLYLLDPETGATTLGQRLIARVMEITKEHQSKPLEPDKKQQVQEILAQVAKV